MTDTSPDDGSRIKPGRPVGLVDESFVLKLSIIIVNYNVKHFLEQCLTSILRAETPFDYEIWVVDNNSSDGSVGMIREKYPQVRLIANKENVGFSRANNQAIRQCKGEYVLLLNPDTICKEDTLALSVGYMEGHSGCGALGVKMIDGKGRFLPESKRGLPTPSAAFYKMTGLHKLFPTSRKFGKYHASYLDENETHEVEVLSGAFMLIRKKVLDEVGLLDEDFFMYGEDIDLSYRILKAGYCNVYFPGTQIIHFKGESTRKESLNYVRLFYKAMIIFTRKHYRHSWLSVAFLGLAIYMRAFAAAGKRLLDSILWPLADAAVLFGGMALIKEFWESVVKAAEGTTYSALYLKFNVPLYIGIWIICMVVSGAYLKPFVWKRLFRGIALGTLLISAVYGFLDMRFRFSRGMILAGALYAVTVLPLLRFLVSAMVRGRKTGASGRRTVIVGSPEAVGNILEIIREVKLQKEFVGYVDAVPGVMDGWLGTLEELPGICVEHNVNEVIFSTESVNLKDIIPYMSTLGEYVDFKLAQRDSLSIIGSNSRNTRGDFYAVDVNFRLRKDYYRRAKRWFDIAAGLALFVAAPVLVFFQQSARDYLKNTLRLITGRRTLVGYYSGQPEDTDGLPHLNQGILHPLSHLTDQEHERELVRKSNLLYARDYSPVTDLQALLRNLGRLGSTGRASGSSSSR